MTKNDVLPAVVFLVDDDPEFRELMAAVFKKRKVDFEAFASPDLFIKRLRERVPTICLIDLHFGGVSMGYQVVQAVRKVLGPKLPLIVTSSTSDLSAVSHAMEIGASDFVIKPVDIDILFTKLEYYSEALRQESSGFTFFPVPDKRSSGKMNLEISVKEIDELGLTLRSPHLFLKGSFLKVHGPLANEVLGDGSFFPVTITSSWVEDGNYVAYAEVDPSAEKTLQALRLWLGNQRT